MIHVCKDNEVCFFLGEEKIGLKIANKQTRKQVFHRDCALTYTSNREVMICTPFQHSRSDLKMFPQHFVHMSITILFMYLNDFLTSSSEIICP